MTRRSRTVLDEVRRRRPELGDPAPLVAAAMVEVDGIPVLNPRSVVRPGASVVVREAPPLRGSIKLRAALEAFAVDASDRVALDVGAAAGGFTHALLEAGARRVYAVDAGHGQLRGWLRQHPRVVNLESTNVAELDATVVPEAVSLVTVDVSYLSLSAAVAQLDRVPLEPGATLIGLVKPMFELRLARAPSDASTLDEARRRAVAGIEASGWTVVGAIESPVRGARGAREALVHALRAG